MHLKIGDPAGAAARAAYYYYSAVITITPRAPPRCRQLLRAAPLGRAGASSSHTRAHIMGCVPGDLCDEERVAWEGAISVEQLPGGTFSAWRLPHDLARTHFAPLPGQLGLLDVAMAHSGVRLVFRSCATRIKLVANARSAHMECVYDLRCDGHLIGSVRQPAAAPISGGKPWHDIEKFLDGDPGAKLLAYMEAVEQAKAQPAPAPHEVCFDIEGSLPVQAEPRTFELWRTPAHSSFVLVVLCVCYNLSPSLYLLLPSHHATALG
eukprot:COSAG01_NODE_15862_length_1291_cov_1.650168_2_plen_265_part_00